MKCLLLLMALGATTGEDGAAPSLELLLHLGRFQTADGEWIDPMSLEQAELDEDDESPDDTDDEDNDSEPAADDEPAGQRA